MKKLQDIKYFRDCYYLPNTQCVGETCGYCGFIRVALANKDEEIEQLKAERDILAQNLSDHWIGKDKEYWLDIARMTREAMEDE